MTVRSTGASEVIRWEADPETVAVWWCRRCGVRRAIDDGGHCRECAYMRSPARRQGREGR
jgi:ribosomal protein L40E